MRRTLKSGQRILLPVTLETCGQTSLFNIIFLFPGISFSSSSSAPPSSSCFSVSFRRRGLSAPLLIMSWQMRGQCGSFLLPLCLLTLCHCPLSVPDLLRPHQSLPSLRLPRVVASVCAPDSLCVCSGLGRVWKVGRTDGAA